MFLTVLLLLVVTMTATSFQHKKPLAQNHHQVKQFEDEKISYSRRLDTIPEPMISYSHRLDKDTGPEDIRRKRPMKKKVSNTKTSRKSMKDAMITSANSPPGYFLLALVLRLLSYLVSD